MFDGIPQELKDQAAEALRKASRDVFEVVAEVESLVEKVSTQLDEWADALAAADAEGGGSDVDTNSYEYKYQYVVDNMKSNSVVLAAAVAQKEWLTTNATGNIVLDGLYEEVVNGRYK